MSHANPTRLRIGMRGEFDGTDYRLVGRVVMSMDDEGDTYYWNEFNLEAGSGETATLVYEETERSGEWRLFKLFEPEYPITAEDAATKRVGDRLNLTDTEVRVTLRDQSRVVRIEGKAPEGVEVGDIANYFNAEARGVMQVVSWTGDEVECYNGVQLSPLGVERAFKLPKLVQPGIVGTLLRKPASNSDNYISIQSFIFWLVIIVVVFFQLIGWKFSALTTSLAAPAKHFAAPAPPLMTGATGQWQGKDFRIIAHATVEIGEVNVVFERHEYELLDKDGSVSLLICGEQPGATNWILYTLLTPYPLPTPLNAAAQKAGDTATVDGVTARVERLFQTTILNMDNVASTTWRNGNVSFGYQGRAASHFLLARWNNWEARFYRGQGVSTNDIIAAFSR